MTDLLALRDRVFKLSHQERLILALALLEHGDEPLVESIVQSVADELAARRLCNVERVPRDPEV